MKKHYTTQQVAEMTGVSLATVNNWIKSDKLKSFKTPGGHNRIRVEDLKEFMNENRIPAPPSMRDSVKPKILVVEDDEDVRDFVLAVINELEYDVESETAKDGFSAGAKIHSSKPDLVILDIMLPGINGIEVCRQIRKEYGKKVKILGVTGYYTDENRKEFMEAGANEFLKKPLDLKTLKKRIKKLLMQGGNRFFLEKKNE